MKLNKEQLEYLAQEEFIERNPKKENLFSKVIQGTTYYVDARNEIRFYGFDSDGKVENTTMEERILRGLNVLDGEQSKLVKE